MELDVVHVRTQQNFGRAKGVQEGGRWGITTNGVSALVHFILRRNEEVPSEEEVSDNVENLLSTEQLSLTLADMDEDDDQIDGGMENILSKAQDGMDTEEQVMIPSV